MTNRNHLLSSCVATNDNSYRYFRQSCPTNYVQTKTSGTEQTVLQLQESKIFVYGRPQSRRPLQCSCVGSRGIRESGSTEIKNRIYSPSGIVHLAATAWYPSGDLVTPVESVLVFVQCRLAVSWVGLEAYI